MLAKTKLNSIEILIYEALINWYISHDKFVSVNNVFKEHDDVKEENINLKNSKVHQRF